MIFVTLGTQDKGFPRLLEAIDREIEKGTIKEKVIVQAGLTEYESKNMEIFDLVSRDKFDEYVDEASLIISHGGAGSILTAVKKDKKVIAVPRLSKYKEHTNDHQLQIVDEFSKEGYILPLIDTDELGDVLKKVKNFKPKKYKSNTKNMEKLVAKYIEEYDNISWFNKYNKILKYISLGIINLLIFILCNLKLRVFTSNFISFIITGYLIFIFYKKYSIKEVGNYIDDLIGFFGVRILYLIIDFGLLYVFSCLIGINNILSKLITIIVIIILDFIYNKCFKKM